MPSIKSELTKGVFWIAIAKYSGIVISLAITAVLARNVSPQAFGTMAVALVIMAFLDIFTELGIGPAIVQYKDLTSEQINTLFMLGCGIGLFFASLLFSCASVIGRYYNDPVLVDIVRWLCICLVFNALNIVPNALMLKNKRFKTIAYRTLTFQILSGTIAIMAAINGMGIYALIITPIVSSIGVFAVNYYNYPQRFTFRIDMEAIRRVWSFSSFQFLFNVVNYFSRNLDKLIIGKHFSMTQLGYYDKSYRLMQLPLQNITFVITPVLHPILSSLQSNPQELSRKNDRLVESLACISFPLGILLYFCAEEIITILFGPGWLPAVPIFRILALSVPLQMILSTSGSIFQAAGDTRRQFLVGLTNTTVTVIGFILSAICFKSIESMAWAWTATLMINFCTSYVVMYRFTFRSGLLGMWKAIKPSIINASVTVLMALAFLILCPKMGMICSLICKTMIIAATTIFAAYLLNQYNIVQIAKQALNRREIA